MNTIPQDNLRHKYYVYTLSKPDGTIFYVGKGRGNRLDHHENEARRGVKSTKCDIIREIWANRDEVVKTKHGEFANEIDALNYESYLIKVHKATLSNVDKDTTGFGHKKANLSPAGELLDAICRAFSTNWKYISIKAGISESTISRDTKRGGQNLSRETLLKICSVLRTYPGWVEEYGENLFMAAGYCTEEMQESAKQYAEDFSQTVLHLPQIRIRKRKK